MDMSKLKDMDTKKKIILFSVIGVIVIGIIILIVVLCNSKEKAYRIIKVFSVEGEVVVSRDGGDINAYESMVLESGDRIVTKNGKMTLRLDEDKYVYVESNTELELFAEGTAENSKTKINLIEGSIVNDIQNKLSADSSYEINTPNSTMAVRGTIYYVHTYIGEDGVRYTKVTVFDGTVATDLVFRDGSTSGVYTVVQKGNEVVIYEDSDTTDYVDGGPKPIDYDDLPDGVKQIVQALIDAGEDLVYEGTISINIPDEEDENPGPFTVSFMYNGNVIAEQVVEKGENASEPILQPAVDGDWNFDFSVPIVEDTTIEWDM